MTSGLWALHVAAQVNAYAAINSIVGTTITLSGADETYDSFEDGEQAIVMQVQDDVVGGYTGNNSSFGNLSTITSTGFWEVVTISSHTESAGVPVSVIITAPLAHPFHTGATRSVQLISYPQLGTPDFTTTTPIVAVPWNGSRGGVVAFQVARKLTIAHNISANGVGFPGGVPSVDYVGICQPTTYTTTSTNNAEKGGSIQRVYSNTIRYGRGKLTNGGGGGNPFNSGGAGGGYVTAGGNGGPGFGCSAVPSGGIAGITIGAYIYWDRFFMGGGGGGGQQNNSLGGAGGAGGGIVILKTDTLRTVGPCVPHHISANGADGGDSVGLIPDGAGGGGSGGTVYMEVNTFQIDPTCTLICEANGGQGGDVVCGAPPIGPGLWLDCGGGGGGGGQGAVMCNSGAASGVSPGTASGTGGANDPGGAQAASAPGPADSGIFGFGFHGSLPVELLFFKANSAIDQVLLEWATASESNSAAFHVERSTDMTAWEVIGSLAAAGHSMQRLDYALKDPTPLGGTSYYRLRSVDIDGSMAVSTAVSVVRSRNENFALHPNPADDLMILTGPVTTDSHVDAIDAMGRIAPLIIHLNNGMATIDVSTLATGVWRLRIELPDGQFAHKPFVVDRASAR
ncbi:MAG: hypothetical protein ABI432_01580 [Flavobacteriales bacterium]